MRFLIVFDFYQWSKIPLCFHTHVRPRLLSKIINQYYLYVLSVVSLVTLWYIFFFLSSSAWALEINLVSTVYCFEDVSIEMQTQRFGFVMKTGRIQLLNFCQSWIEVFTIKGRFWKDLICILCIVFWMAMGSELN